MQLVEILVVLFICAVALSWVARRLNVPYPIALVLGGAALGFFPHLPRMQFDPNLILVIVLPPVLYSAAYFTSWRGVPTMSAASPMSASGPGLAPPRAVSTGAASLAGMAWS